MKIGHKIFVGVSFVGVFFLVATVHANAGQIKHQVFVRPIVGVVTAEISDRDSDLAIHADSTAAITSYAIETINSRLLRSDAPVLSSNVQTDSRVLVIGAVSVTNITAKVIGDGILPQTTGPPTDTRAV